jgi:hypothetical protein
MIRFRNCPSYHQSADLEDGKPVMKGGKVLADGLPPTMRQPVAHHGRLRYSWRRPINTVSLAECALEEPHEMMTKLTGLRYSLSRRQFYSVPVDVQGYLVRKSQAGFDYLRPTSSPLNMRRPSSRLKTEERLAEAA